MASLNLTSLQFCLKHHRLITYAFIRYYTKDSDFIPNDVMALCCRYYAHRISDEPLNYDSALSFVVVCRLRHRDRQNSQNEEIKMLSNQQISIDRDKPKPKLNFSFDRIFKSNTSQSDFYYQCAEDLVNQCVNGYNASIMLYGQSGTGKVFTLFGPQKIELQSQFGIIQRCGAYLLHRLECSQNVKSWKCKLSAIGLFKSKLMDPFKKGHINPGGGPIHHEVKTMFDVETNSILINDLTQIPINGIDDLLKHLNESIYKKMTLAFNSYLYNLIITLSVEQKIDNGKVRVSTMKFVKFHGSEDVRRQLTNNDREKIMYLKRIQTNLTAFINAIQDVRMGRLVPRNSNVFVLLLHDTICGKAKTLIILTASCDVCNKSETLRTLRFGYCALRNVRIDPKINEFQEKCLRTTKVIIKEGFMTKEGKLFKTWKRRYFILSGGGVLKYYKRKGDDAEISSLNVKDVTEIKQVSFGKERECGLQINTNKRIWKFACVDNKEREKWINTIKQAQN